MSQPRPRIRQTIYGNWYGVNTPPDMQVYFFRNKAKAREWLNKQLANSKNETTNRRHN